MSTEPTTPPPVPAAAAPLPNPQALPTAPAALLAGLRRDPAKLRTGVWFTHPDSGDQFRCRKLWGPEHNRAHMAVTQQLLQDRGEAYAKSEQGIREAFCCGLAGGLVTDWKLVGSDRPYEAATMAALLLAPDLEHLVDWLLHVTNRHQPYTPDAGN